MALSSLSATNFSVKNAQEFVNTVKNGSRILSFFIGGSQEETSTNLNTENRRYEVFKDASVISKIQPSHVNVVAPNIVWTKQIYQRWKSDTIISGNYYVTNNNNVYLILSNDEFNRKNYDAKIFTSIPPTHTSGVMTYDDGYSYLYLYTITATDKANVNSANWISVPDKILTSHAGKIIYISIDINSISASNLIINKKDPVIPILSDTGSGAEIRFRTHVVSSPYATTSEKRYKIIGIDVVNYGTIPYADYDLESSLMQALPEQSYAQIYDILTSITLGFSSIEGISLREILQAKYALVTCQLDSSEITSISDQRQFFNFGVLEDIKRTTGESLFTGSDENQKFSNNVKLTIAQLGTAGYVPAKEDFERTDLLIPQITSKVQKGTLVSSKQATSVTVDLEVHTTDVNLYDVGSQVKLIKNNNTYTIVDVEKPVVKQNSGKSLHIGPCNFNIDNSEVVNKRFFAQVIQRF